MKLVINPFNFWRTELNTSPISVDELKRIEKKYNAVGQKISNTIVQMMGSWRFILVQTFLMVIWIIVNFIAIVEHWDPYPFILLNLLLSIQAAYAAPIIMMSQNRQAAHDRLEAHKDFLINQKSEKEIRLIISKLEEQHQQILKLQQLLIAREENASRVT